MAITSNNNSIMRHSKRIGGVAAALRILSMVALYSPSLRGDGHLQETIRGGSNSTQRRRQLSLADPRTVELVNRDGNFPIANTHTLSVVSESGTVNYQYLTQDDAPAMSRYKRLKWTKPKFVYLRTQEEIAARSDAAGSGLDGDRCAPSVEVLAWLMDEVNSRSGTLMLTYGGLIHLHREKEFVDVKTGRYLDDDFDLWSSLETMEIIGSLEHVFYEKFGWSMRFIHFHRHIMLMQAFPVCGHVVVVDGRGRRLKVQGAKAARNHEGQVGLEIYPMAILPMVSSDRGMVQGDSLGEGNKAKCLWEGIQFPVSMIYPTKRVDIKTVASKETLHLQIPNDPLGFLRCVYGEWEVPSKSHKALKQDCTDFYVKGGTAN